MRPAPLRIAAAVAAGALGYVSDSGLHDLHLVLRLVACGGFGCCSASARELVRRLGLHTTLSARETIIAAQIGAGQTNTEIASALAVKASTIDTYVGRILRKISGRTRIDIATWWQRQAGLHDVATRSRDDGAG
jgi:DNA-binding NarL/FixJ family response regulator